MSKKLKKNARVVSRFSLYLMANPDASHQDFILDTGGKIKDWDNAKIGRAHV